MINSPESVVRTFFAAWADPRADNLVTFFNDDGVWVDGAQGVHRGADAIARELARQLAVSHPITVEVITLVANGGTVMVESHSAWAMGGKPISAPVMAVFEVDANARISQWRESYDLKSITDQIEAAGSSAPA